MPSELTLRAACEMLQSRGFTVQLGTMKHAAKSGRLKATLQDAPHPYYLTTETDAIEWAKDRKRGNPNWRKG